MSKTMSCEKFDTRLDALLDGRCAPDEWREAESHMAACARCRRLFDAMAGRADDMDAAAHASFAASVVARTSGSGSACASARERLCDFTDGLLAPVDRQLVEGHLAHCRACAALAAAVSEATALLPSFATLAPRHGIVGAVIASTSGRVPEPGLVERIAGWIARVAERPRFSLEAAYVMTLLVLIAFGNPVSAFREASVRVQPRVAAVAVAVNGPLNGVRAAGAEKLSHVERALAPKLTKPQLTDQAEALLRQLIDDSGVQRIAASVRSVASQAAAWAARVLDAVREAFGSDPTEPGTRSGRS
jgi:anti-sigma factor RsiW